TTIVTVIPTSAVEEFENAIPTAFALRQNYPNPFNPSTMISFQLPVRSEITLAIYNANGQLVKKLFAGAMNAGNHSVVWKARDESGRQVASGVYIYVLQAGEFVARRKLVLLQ
ncbi:MAG: FlgD immunoglobulin-like domain containing protein, partial [candidate division KSB1 bacterium]